MRWRSRIEGTGFSHGHAPALMNATFVTWQLLHAATAGDRRLQTLSSVHWITDTQMSFRQTQWVMSEVQKTRAVQSDIVLKPVTDRLEDSATQTHCASGGSTAPLCAGCSLELQRWLVFPATAAKPFWAQTQDKRALLRGAWIPKEGARERCVVPAPRQRRVD